MTKSSIDKAIEAYKNQQPDKAKSICRRILKSKNNIAMPYYILGLIAKDEELFELSITQFKKALAIEPTRYTHTFNLASAYGGAGKHQKAIETYLKAIEIEPKASAYSNLGSTYLKINELNNALITLEKAVELDPLSAEAQNNLGLVLGKLGKIQEAEEHHQHAIELMPELIPAYTNLASLCFDQSKYNEAIELYIKVIELQPDYAEIYKFLGSLYDRIGNQTKAVHNYKTYLNYQPDDHSVIHIINALAGSTSEIAPPEYIEELFDDYAENFDRHLVSTLKYQIPENIGQIAKSLLSTCYSKKFGNALDLGCGTGLVGQYVAPLCEVIEGIDLSSEMLEKAREKDIYSRLIKCDVVAFLASDHQIRHYDLISAADVLIYLGDLNALFDNISQRLSVDNAAFFLFSIESITGEGFQLQPSGRYAHSSSYIESITTNHNFDIVINNETVIRTEGNQPIAGRIIAVKKK